MIAVAIGPDPVARYPWSYAPGCERAADARAQRSQQHPDAEPPPGAPDARPPTERPAAVARCFSRRIRSSSTLRTRSSAHEITAMLSMLASMITKRSGERQAFRIRKRTPVARSRAGRRCGDWFSVRRYRAEECPRPLLGGIERGRSAGQALHRDRRAAGGPSVAGGGSRTTAARTASRSPRRRRRGRGRGRAACGRSCSAAGGARARAVARP